MKVGQVADSIHQIMGNPAGTKLWLYEVYYYYNNKIKLLLYYIILLVDLRIIFVIGSVT